MNKLSFKNVMAPALVLIIICVIVALALSSTNALTKDKITEINAANEQAAMKRVITADDYEKKSVTGDDGKTYDYYVASSNSKPAGYVFTIGNNGYGGEVSVMTGIDTSGTITAIEVIDASDETPGLGQNSTKADFWSQFAGKSGKLEVSKSASGDDQIQALTGATITSKAVTKSVNTALELFEQVKKGA